MITAVFETLDFCVRTAQLREAPAVLPVVLYEPIPPESPHVRDLSAERRTSKKGFRVYKRQWARDGIAYYREEWRDDA